MRGSLRRRGKSWAIVVDLGYRPHPETGRLTRRQKFVTFRGTKGQAEKKLAEMVSRVGNQDFVEPSKVTLGEWISDWIDKAHKPPRGAQSTYDKYTGILTNHIMPKLGHIRLQALRHLDLENYYAGLTTLDASTIQGHHTLIHSALKAAEIGGFVARNVAQRVTNKPKKAATHDALEHVWTAQEAARFLTVAKAAGPQKAAFYSVALDTGARRGELGALKWTDLDHETGRLTIQRHLVEGGQQPVFGPTKTKTSRTVELSAETLALLREHRRHQAEVKIKNRQHYKDHGLIFAKQWGDLHARVDSLGAPIGVNNIGTREYARLIKAAGVKRIKFHGMRHTMATLMLSAGVPPHIVQRRLGHSRVEMTLNIYAHALPSMQQDAASKLALLLHG